VKTFAHALLIAVVAAASAAAQDAPDKILRPVYFPPAQSSAILDKEGATLISGTPEMLATSIASVQPITRADSETAARSVVTITASPSADGRVTVRVRLLESGLEKKVTSKVFTAPAVNLSEFRTFVIATAAAFAPLLGPVAPETSILKTSSQQQLIRAAQATDYLDQLDKRLEFTLWMSGLLRILDSTAGGGGGGNQNATYVFALDILPLIAEATWFYSKDLGLQLSFYFNRSNAFDYGSGSRHNAYGLFLFPGVGFVYRTLGEISAELAITLSAGWISVTANSGNVVDKNNNVVIPQGSTVWSSLSPRIRLSPSIMWSITPSVGLKGSIGFDFIVPGLSWYDSPLIDLQFLSVGAAYRL
jgi:hypothetical protein